MIHVFHEHVIISKFHPCHKDFTMIAIANHFRLPASMTSLKIDLNHTVHEVEHHFSSFKHAQSGQHDTYLITIPNLRI